MIVSHCSSTKIGTGDNEWHAASTRGQSVLNDLCLPSNGLSLVPNGRKIVNSKQSETQIVSLVKVGLRAQNAI